MDRGFLRKVIKLGESARADLSHGNGVTNEVDAQDFIEHYSKHLSESAVEFAKVSDKLKLQFPNLNKS